jgi:assimilatory nitrate reductase catalytic subunit
VSERRTSLPIVPPGVGDFREAGAGAAEGWRADQREFELVPTHCCFCGVQCGMYLKVDTEGRVFGVEPRDHDINNMKLCPKGVVAYQQVNHPDRLTVPLMRDRRSDPLRPVSWEVALDRVVSEIRRIQGSYGAMRSPSTADRPSPPRSLTSWASSPGWRSAPGTSTTTGACAW